MKKAGLWPCLLVDREAGYFFSAAFFGSPFGLASPFADALAAGLAQLLTNFLRSSPLRPFSSACLPHSCCFFCAAVGSFLGASFFISVDFAGAAFFSAFFSCAMAVTLAAANIAATITDSSLLISFSWLVFEHGPTQPLRRHPVVNNAAPGGEVDSSALKPPRGPAF